jgi:hypothetical protein
LDWHATLGQQHTLIARATNAAGQTQPLQEEWNPSGYLWNVAQPVNVEVTEKGATPIPAESHSPAHPPGYQSACLTCHDERMMVQQRLTPAQWDREVNKMVGWGAPVKPDDRKAILEYLSTQFKP